MAPMNDGKNERLATALADLKEDEVNAIVKERLENNRDPLEILDGLREGLKVVGSKYEEGEYFLSELVTGGVLFKNAFEIIKPRLQLQSEKNIGKFVIGTVQGDIHDLGKDIVAIMLECNGFKVYDLGVDVPPEEFVKKAREVNAELVGLSALLTACIESIKETIEGFKEAGLRSKVKIIIGGGIMNEAVMKKVGADAYADDALSAVKVAKEMLKAQSRTQQKK